MRYTEVEAVMYIDLRSSSPKAMLAVYSGTPITPSAAAVDVAGRVHLHAVGRAGSLTLGLRPHAATRHPARGGDVEDADVLARGVVHEQPPPIEREAQAVRPLEVVHQQHR
jgi:hypothetical protein